MGFITSLLSADGKLSSKRFAGLILVGTFVAITVLAAAGGNCPEEVESLAKVGLYTGASLLGVSLAPEMIKNAQRPAPIVPVVEVKEKEKEDERDK